MTRNKHLSDYDRGFIEQLLHARTPIREIAARLGKHRTTIWREIKARSVVSDKGAYGRITNRCVHRRDCQLSQLCRDRPDCLRRCASCSRCNAVCGKFEEERCARLGEEPFVCNGCPDERRCTLRKRYYVRDAAQRQYRRVLSESRAGADATDEELATMDALLVPLSAKGQSIHHVIVNNAASFTVAERTVYRYVSKRILALKRGDMPRACRLRPRKSKPRQHKVDAKCRQGRTYGDYCRFLVDNPGVHAAELDTVEGRKGGKVVTTLRLRDCGLLLAFLQDRKDAASVTALFNDLWIRLGPDLFRALFPVILTDNGTEFSDPSSIETAPDGTPRTKVFYCDPGASNQKGAIEREHVELRRVLEKGTSFDGLTQRRLDLVLCHVNSYSRPARGDKSPVEVFEFIYGEGVAARLGLRRIPANEVTLTRKLLEVELPE